jgi:hypothetical protein
MFSVWFVASGKRYELEERAVRGRCCVRSGFAKGCYFNDHIRYRLVTSGNDPG